MRGIIKIIFVFAFGVIIALLLYRPQIVQAQACETPAQVPNVLASYPSCDSSGSCNFTQAKCSWGAVSDAASYQVTITEVGASPAIYDQRVASTVSDVSVGITQGKTYRCDVAAINACGNQGPPGTHSVLCQADAGITTPTAPPTPVIIPITPPAPGVLETSIVIGTISILIIVLGGILLLL